MLLSIPNFFDVSVAFQLIFAFTSDLEIRFLITKFAALVYTYRYSKNCDHVILNDKLRQGLVNIWTVVNTGSLSAICLAEWTG
jgi:hypothetical protein